MTRMLRRTQEPLGMRTSKLFGRQCRESVVAGLLRILGQ